MEEIATIAAGLLLIAKKYWREILPIFEKLKTRPKVT